VVKSFQDLFCEEHRCKEDEFSGKVFWRALYPHAWPFVPFLGGCRSDYFAADRELISGAGRATTMIQLRTEIADFVMDANNRGWLRQRARVRVSTTRLKRLARRYLPGEDSPAPFAKGA
jgi:hypothetical protein